MNIDNKKHTCKCWCHELWNNVIGTAKDWDVLCKFCTLLKFLLCLLYAVFWPIYYCIPFLLLRVKGGYTIKFCLYGFGDFCRCMYYECVCLMWAHVHLSWRTCIQNFILQHLSYIVYPTVFIVILDWDRLSVCFMGLWQEGESLSCYNRLHM